MDIIDYKFVDKKSKGALEFIEKYIPENILKLNAHLIERCIDNSFYQIAHREANRYREIIKEKN